MSSYTTETDVSLQYKVWKGGGLEPKAEQGLPLPYRSSP